MRKRLLVLLLALIAVAGLLPGGALAQSYLLRTVDGVTYEYNQQITTILYAGVDSEGPMTTTDRYTIAPRADTINLVILDGYHGTLRVLAIIGGLTLLIPGTVSDLIGLVIVAAIIVIILNYVISKLLVFRKKKEDK